MVSFGPPGLARQTTPVWLTGPDGTAVTLHNRKRGVNIAGNYQNTLLVDGPGALSDFIGKAGNGSWTLRAADYAPGDVGVLNSWGVHLLCR